MGSRQTLPIGLGTAQWPMWSTTARLAVTDPALLSAARSLVEEQLGAVEAACDRFRPGSELRRLDQAAGRPVTVSPLFADLIRAALRAADRTGGDIDPTVGGARRAQDRDLSLIPVCGSVVRTSGGDAPGWRQIRLHDREVTVPAGVALDLTATARAFAVDRCAQLAAERWGCGVLVRLGEDVATAGPAADGGWRVVVQDRAGDRCTVALPAGAALATSSTAGGRWRRGGWLLPRLLTSRSRPPAQGQPAMQGQPAVQRRPGAHRGRPGTPVWRSVSVAAPECVKASTLAAAALVRESVALPWLRQLGVPARLVTAAGREHTVGDWPAEPPGGR